MRSITIALTIAVSVGSSVAAEADNYYGVPTRVQVSLVITATTPGGSVIINGREIRFGTGWGCPTMLTEVLDGLIEAVHLKIRTGINTIRSSSGRECVGTVNFFAPP